MGRIYSLEDFATDLAEAYKDMDVIVAAGDVGSGENAVGFLRMAFPEKPVIFTPGNHEFWGDEIFSTHNKMQAACEGTNIHYLPAGETVEVEGVRFCGATLWTDYLLTDSAYSMTSAENLMNDFRRIRIRRLSASGISGAYSHLRPQHLLGFHRQHLLHIKSEMALAVNEDAILVVVTHHAPSAQSLWFDSERGAMEVMKSFGSQPSDPCYCSHLDYLMMGEDAPQYWIHGHTHIAVDYRVGNTRIVSNPKGYAQGDDTAWEIGRYIEVPT